MAVITNMPLIPVDTISGFPVRPGNHLIQGATAMPNAVNFTISSANATSCAKMPQTITSITHGWLPKALTGAICAVRSSPCGI